ncbi:MAG TPA: AMP-binding protein, partial [Acidimicrobiales bacterium]|nr:AMP-binding protein [Acidimicrobiales bacterium]
AGAPLGARLGHFFDGIGVTVLEVYGLTETIGATFNPPDALRIGTVGRPIPGVELRLDPDGEVLLRGPNVFAGYWHNEAATAEALDSGWLRTGDVGSVDADGYLSITGRKKELLVTAGGKNVAPAPLEDRLRSHPLVSQCMVVGEGRPYVAALVTLDAEAWPAWAAARTDHGEVGLLADHLEDPEVRAEVQRAVDQANAAVSRAESIRRFLLLPDDFTQESGELTPTLKLRRAVIYAKRAEAIERLYR